MSTTAVSSAAQRINQIPDLPGIRVVIIASRDQLDGAQYYADALRSKKMEVWSIADAVAGQVIDLVVSKKLKEAHFIVVLVDSQSVVSKGTHQKHLKMALKLQDEMPEGAIKVVPALLEYIDRDALPSNLRGLWCAYFYAQGGGAPLLEAFVQEWERRKDVGDL